MGTRIQQGVGVGAALIPIFPPPVLAQRAPASTDVNYPVGQVWIDQSVSPPVSYEFLDSSNGTWQTGGNAHASTTEFGIVILNDSITMAGATNDQVPTALAIKTYADNLVIAGAPVATEVTAGIGQLATNAEAVAGTASTPALALFVTPSNLASVFAAPPATGGTTPAAGTFTSLTADGTGTVTLTSNAASVYDVTGAGNDLTLSSDAGRVVVNGEEAAADAVRIVSAAGGLDVDVALQMNLVSSQNAADAIVVNASAGGIDITAAGAAGEDIDIVNTAGSINLTAGESIASSMVFTNNGMQVVTSGAAARDISMVNTGGSIVLSASEAVADAINVDATAGGIDVDAVGQVNIASSQNAADSIVITSSAGGIDILAAGATAGEDIDIVATGSSVNIESTEDAALAVYLHANGGTSETIRLRADQGTGVASIDILSDVGGVTVTGGLGTADAVNIVASNAAGGIDIDAGTGGVIVDTTGAFSIDGAAASNVTVTGAGIDLTLDSAAGRLVLTGGEAAADAVRVQADDAGGGIDVDAGTAGIAIDTTGAFSIDGAAASNVTVTGAGIDLTLASVLGSVLVSSTEDVANCIMLHANGGTSETIRLRSDQGTGVASIDVLSDVGGITLTSGLASADAINLAASAGGVDIDGALQVNIASSQNAADAVRIIASAGGIDIDAVGAAGEDIVITNTGGSVSVVATEAAADSIVLSSSAGGIDILAPGAGAGLDIDIVNTGGSVNITATEAAANAIVLTASNAAGGIDITTGGGSVDISSAGFVTMVAATDTQASPSATATINANVGIAYFTGFTTAAGSSQVFVITNSVVTTTSAVLVTADNLGANDCQFTITRVLKAAGSLSVTLTNNGAAACNGNVAISFWVFDVA